METAPSPAVKSAAVKSADRVLDLLEHLARHPAGRTHAEIATALAIPKGSLTPLLRNLLARGWLATAPSGSRYLLGEAALALGRPAAGAAGRLLAAAPPILRRLTMATEESSSLNLRRGGEVEVVACAHSDLPLLYAMRLGDRAPLHAISGGKAILAALPESEREAWIAGARLDPVTPRTITTAAVLRAELARAAAEGLAYSFEEFTPGIIGMAAAVGGPGRQPIASINVAIPAVRFDDAKRARCAAALREAAAALAEAAPASAA